MLSVKKTHYSHPRARSKIQRRVEQTAEVFQKYGSEIYSVILFHLNDSSMADDIFQELFLTLVHRPVPPDTKNIKAYIYKTITNDIFDAMRRIKNYKNRVERYSEEQAPDYSKGNPEKILVRKEQMQKLFELIEAQLPPRQAEAIILRYKNNRSITETAEEMGVHKTTISRYVWAGIKKIHRLIFSSRVESDVC